MCPFCVHVVFDRVTSGHVVKIYWFFHLGYVVNFLYIVSHVKFEADLCTEERNQLVNFGKIGYTGLQSKNGVSRLFSNRIYDLEMIYYVVGNNRNLLHENVTDCMLKLVELDNSHKSKGGRLDTLYWLDPFLPRS